MDTSFLNPDILREISQTGNGSVTGWGVALLLSIAFNYIIYREFKMLQSKLLDHLESLADSLDKLTSFFNHKN